MKSFDFPDPNSVKKSGKNTVVFIESHEGTSLVDVHSPECMYPLLPYRYSNKLLFPTGSFTGWYTHVELREAMKHGYVVKKVHKTYYYEKTCNPFTDFVTDLYKKRQDYKLLGSPMEFVCKILMNSLYGKFGQKFVDKDNWIPKHTIDDIDVYDKFEIIGDFIRVVIKESKPSTFCIPIWASYISALGRLKLHDYLVRGDAVYCDTDSVITRKDFGNSTDLGKLKHEYDINEAWIVKPKMYAIDNGEYKFVKVKGLPFRLTYEDFVSYVCNPNRSLTFSKFTKFKEASRRGLTPNEIILANKCFGVEDEKRRWPALFDGSLQWSKALNMSNGLLDESYIDGHLKTVPLTVTNT